ncbi:MAG: hypothetical protein Q9208_006716 [Pyrenodesmia sp. 3 TL-2023]
MAESGTPHAHGDENRQGAMLGTTVTVTSLTALVVALRMATRIWLVRNVGWDDYTIVAACLGHVVALGLVIMQIHYGFGRHRDYLTERQNTQFLKYSYGEWIQTFQTLMFTKLSICFLLLRIPVEKYFIRPLQGAIAFLVVTNVVLTFLWIFQCNPIAGAWDKKRPATCLTDAQLLRVIISQAIISIISDFALALFPIVILWKVQIEMRIKAGLCFLMSLGLMTAACCIVRTVMNWQNVNSDPTWASVNNWYWRSWEVSVGIVAASIPALRPGWRVVSSSIKSYLSHLSVPEPGDETLVGPGHPSHPKLASFIKQFRQTSHTPAVEAAAHTASVGAHEAQAYGAGEEGFAMRSLPGDKQTSAGGTRKTTTIDIEHKRSQSSQRSSVLADIEGGARNKYFV